MRIPKIVFQSWKQEGQWPENPAYPIDRQVATWKERNPDFSYRFFSDQDCLDFVRSEYPDVFPIYWKIPPIKRADLWRYLAIHRWGGVYADIDCVCVRPLRELIRPEDELIAGLEYEPGERKLLRGEPGRPAPGRAFTNWVVMARPGHPVLEATIQAAMARLADETPDRYETMSRRQWRLDVLSSTGPILWSRVVESHAGSAGMRLGPKDWFGVGESIHEATKKLSPDARLGEWLRSVDYCARHPGPNRGAPVYVLHTYLGSWKNWVPGKSPRRRIRKVLRRWLAGPGPP